MCVAQIQDKGIQEEESWVLQAPKPGRTQSQWYLPPHTVAILVFFTQHHTAKEW